MSEEYHIPVMLSETVDALGVQPNGVYVDCTLGGGGHSSYLLQQLGKDGRLYCFDQDADAKSNIPNDDRVIFVHSNFRNLQKMLRFNGVQQVDGIMADLGVSSHQFDEAARGFSIRFNAALDMRMDQRQSITAADVLANKTEAELHKIFEKYGEVTNSKTLAKTIVTDRQRKPILTIDDLKSSVAPIVKGIPQKYLAQVFQALRIEVNEELIVLQELLQQMALVLKPGGHAAVITFHSLEDRLVKNYFKKGVFEESTIDENPFSTETKTYPFKPATKKPIEPSKEEQKQNPRSRSAKLRVAIRN
jgi:16S rRNA (cytosine1402-N4)-methyltransferase